MWGKDLVVCQFLYLIKSVVVFSAKFLPYFDDCFREVNILSEVS